jgi:predicted outer membrane lipoprotein
MILGMDPLVFTAWIGTIIAAAFCVLYGIYYEFIKKQKKETKKAPSKGDK